MLIALDVPREAARQALLASRALLVADGPSKAEAVRGLIEAIRLLNRLAPVLPQLPRLALRIPRRPMPRAPLRTADAEGQHRQEVRGSKELLLEILKRAINDLTLYRLHSDLPRRQLADDAYVWLFLEEPGHPAWVTRITDDRAITGFVTICELLDIDPDKVREHINKLKPEDVRNAGRPPELRRLRFEDSGRDGG